MVVHHDYQLVEMILASLIARVHDLQTRITELEGDLTRSRDELTSARVTAQKAHRALRLLKEQLAVHRGPKHPPEAE